MTRRGFIHRLKQPAMLSALGGFIIGAVVAGLILWALPNSFIASKYEGATLRQSSTGYEYVRPLLMCDIASEDAFTNLAPLKQSLESIISNDKNSGKVESVSIYFRSLHDSHWFDINPDEKYAPASLDKLFVMMAYLKATESPGETTLLERPLALQPLTGNPLYAEPGTDYPRLTPGQRYTVDSLITQMIVYSDNDALNTLANNMDATTTSAIEQIFSDLKIASPLSQSQQVTDFMTVDEYATAFRVLQSGTYLSRYNSDLALKLLTQAKYNAGLVAGVPAGTIVAHKYGASPGAGSEGPELHDCGIIYDSNYPYLLCVMTRGSDYATLQSVIQSLSAQTYSEMQKIYPDQVKRTN